MIRLQEFNTQLCIGEGVEGAKDKKNWYMYTNLFSI